MKTTVTIIAHNEEKYIGKCIDSIISQSLKPDEIIVVCHNSTDKTEEIVLKYVQMFNNIFLIKFSGPPGTVFSRMKAIESAKNEFIVCIDGDAMAQNNWLKNLINKINKDSSIVAVGGFVILKSWYWFFVCLNFFFFKFLFREGQFYFWGSNCVLRKSAYDKVGGIQKLIDCKDKIGLTEVAEDYFLSMELKKVGKVLCARDAIVIVEPKEFSFLTTRKRIKNSLLNIKKQAKYFRYV